MGSKFEGLTTYLENLKEDSIGLTFKQIESLTGTKLCDSAYNYREYWYRDKTHTFPDSWLNAGWVMSSLDIHSQHVAFARTTCSSIQKEKRTLPDSAASIRTYRASYTPAYEVKVSIVVEKVEKFYKDLQTDPNARYLSWEHCYKQFQKAHGSPDDLTSEKLDYLSLHLAFYLASWGMLRGSSFLLQKDYKVHYDAIKLLLNPIYGGLWDINYLNLQKSENLDMLFEVIREMKAIYRGKRKGIKDSEQDISDILITKILMGVMGCLPAYDEYFKKGIGKNNITTQLLSKRSVYGLTKYYENNLVALEDVRLRISNSRGFEYPQMKILDMGFWQLGLDME